MLPKLFFIFILSFLILTHSYGQCVEDQKSLLLQLKNELIFNSSLSAKLVQWNERDECCKWYGVECDAAGSGHVISLQLDNESISGGIGNSSSLFRLKHLEKLNLAYNHFNFAQIPRGIHNLTYLTHLNLSYASFDGQVPAEISSLTRLVSLDISNNFLSLKYPNLEMLVQNLTGLTELYLDYVNITSSHERRKWSHIISSYLPNLTTLSMNWCSLSGPLVRSFRQLHSLSILRLDFNDLSTIVPDLFANFSSLTTLSLANCSLNGSFPNMIFHIPSLQNLDLSWNDKLSGSIPPFPQSGFLKSIRLSYTNLSGLIPSSISNLKTLSEIDLHNSKFTGAIPSTFANLTELVYVDLSSNLFTGPLSSTVFEGLSNLVYLNLEYNSFSGNIPHSLFGLPSVKNLYLGNNQFIGLVEEFPIVNVSNIVDLDLNSNQLEGPIPDSFFQLQSLESLDLSGNSFNGTFQRDKIQSLANLTSLHHFPAYLEYLDLSSNQLRGELHLPNTGNRKSNFKYLLLANNSFSGSIPISLCNAAYTIVLDLSVNKFSGSIPPCLLEKIVMLDLGQNNISGHIPDNFSLNCSLQYLDLNNNTLEGKVPKSLKSCRFLEVMNVGNNMINDTFPCMLSSTTLRVLVLHSNKFHGELRCHESWPELQILDISSNNFSGSLESTNFSSWTAMVLRSDAQLSHDYYSLWGFGVTLIMKGLGMQLKKIWPEFNAIDFSCNNFRGEIPNAIGDLNSLHHLNFSNNALNGSIPKSFGQLRKLESLDLSENQLTGAIPLELAGLTFLQVLNLSYNKLVGRIPNGSQLQTFSADSFEGNPELCGFNLNISCSHTDDNDSSPREDENVEEKREIEWEYVCAALGYVVGLGIIAWLLLFCRSFREKYFGKIDEVVEEIFDGRRRKRTRWRRIRARRVARNRARRQ